MKLRQTLAYERLGMSSSSPQQIRSWVEHARNSDARWLLIAHDSFDGEDYPVPIAAAEDAWARHDELIAAGERIHEAYDLGGNAESIERQLTTRRAWSMPVRGGASTGSDGGD